MKVSLIVSVICLSLFYFNTVFGQEGGGGGPLASPRVYLEVAERFEDVYVKIKADDLEQKLFGVGFDLIYDNSILDYQNYERGTVFPPHALHLVDQSENRLTTGISLKRGDNLVSVQDDDFLLSFHFKRRAQGILHFRFADGVLVTLNAGVRENISPVIWEEYQGNTVGHMGTINLLKWNFSQEAIYFVVVLLSVSFLVALGILSYGLYLRNKPI